MDDHEAPPRVLFVCVGNICRSPLAQAMAQQICGELAVFESAGVAALHGHGAASDMIVIGRELGVELSRHRARDVSDLNLDDYDLIVALTPSIASTLQRRFDVPPDRLVTLDVDDPYGGAFDDYRICASEIDQAVRELKGTLSSGAHHDRNDEQGR